MEDPPTTILPFPPRRWADAPRTARDGRPIRRTERRVTALAAELRGWQTFAQRGPTALAAIADRAMDAMVALGAYEVRLDGVSEQPGFSGTFEGEGHALRALRAAVAIRNAVEDAASAAPEARELQVCAGVNTGAVIEMALASPQPVPFAAIGTLRSFAQRLQEFAGPGQVFLSATTLREAGDLIAARPVGEVRLNAHGETEAGFCLLALSPDGDEGRRS